MSRSGGYPFQSHRQRDALSARTKIDNSVNHVVSELTDEELPIARPAPRPAAVREGREAKSVTATVLAAMAEVEDLRAERSQLRREVDELKQSRTRLQAETGSVAPTTTGGAKTDPAPAPPPPPSVDNSKELARTREQMRGMQSSLDTVMETLAELKTTVSGVNWSVSQLHSGQQDIKAHIDLAKRPVLEAVKALPVVQAASTPEENPTTKAAAEETVVTPAAVEQTTPPPPKEVEEKKEAEAVSKVDGEKAEAAAEGEEKKEAEASASKADEAKTEAAATTAEESTAAAQAVALETVVQAQQKELGDVKAVLNEMRGMQAALLKMMEAQAADANRRQLAEYEMRQNAEKVAKAEAERAAAAAAAAAAPALIAPGAAVVATTASTAPATVGQQPAAAPGQQQPLATPVGISPTAAAAAAVTPGEYEIAITTGTGRGAGTDATVSVALRGEKGWVELPQLGASREHPKNPFEAKQTDTFVVVASQGELGELSELRIGHDGAGMLSNWQLMEVKVCHTLTGAAWLFPAMGTFGEKGIWLKKNASKELKAQKVKAAAVLPPVLPPAAPLAAPLSGGEAGRAAHATQPTPVVAEEAAVPRAAPEGAAAVPVPVPVSADSAVVRNPMLTSLPEEEEEQPVATAAAAVPPVVPPAVPPVVRKASGQAEKAAEKAAAKAAAAAGRQSATDVQYVVQITTGGSLGAGTDADVTLELLGDKSDVWWRCPSLGASRENPANPFEQNDVDTFEVWCPVQLGELVRARIGHDGSGLMSDWQMAGVTVEAVELRKIWSFPCRSVWVKKNKPVEIAAKAVPAAA